MSLEPRSGPARRRIRESLDAADLRIIDLLGRDGRTSNRDLAAQVGLTEATVGSRIRTLSERRVLGISTVFDWEVAGYAIDVWLTVSVGGRDVEDVAVDIASLGPAHTVLLVFGVADIVVHALFVDREEEIAFLTTQLGSIAGVVAVTPDETLRTWKYTVNYARLPLPQGAPRLPSTELALDRTDLSVIEALRADGRRSNRDIARELGISDGTVRTRLGRLEQMGLLRISAQIDPYLTGRADAWAYVGIEVDGSLIDKVIQALVATPEILIVAHVCGRFQLVVLAVTPSRSRLSELVLGTVRGLPGVRSTRTSDVIGTTRADYHLVRLLD